MLSRKPLAVVALLAFGLWPASGLVRVEAAPAPETDEARVADYIKALKSKNATVRKQVAAALGELGPKAKAAVPALRQALLDPDEGVQSAAAAALEKITGSGAKQPARGNAELIKKVRAEMEAARREAQAQTDRARAAEEEARQRAEQAQAVARKLQDEMQRARADAAKKEAVLKKMTADLNNLAQKEAERRKADLAELAKLLREKDAKLADLQKQIAAERDKAVTAQIEAAALKKRNDALVSDLKKTIEALTRQQAEVTKSPPPKEVEGKIKTVDGRGST